MPPEFPPWQNVYRTFRPWAAGGKFEQMHDRLRAPWRSRNRSSPQRGPSDYNAGAKVKGRNRYLLVETPGAAAGGERDTSRPTGSGRRHHGDPGSARQVSEPGEAVCRWWYSGACAAPIRHEHQGDVVVVRHPANRSVRHSISPALAEERGFWEDRGRPPIGLLTPTPARAILWTYYVFVLSLRSVAEMPLGRIRVAHRVRFYGSTDRRQNVDVDNQNAPFRANGNDIAMAEKTVAFSDLLSLFPVCDGPSSFPFETDCRHFRYEIKENRRFVPPTLRVINEPPKGKAPSVVVISASAAVGKTTVAQTIAYRLQAPLWDLSQFTLGDGTFTGIPRRCFGSTAFNSVETRMRSGSFLYVLDALDEARAKSSQGFEAFLLDLCNETRSEKPKASLVLFGRTESCVLASLYLETMEVGFAHYSIDFFSRPQAETFIDEYLHRRAKHDHRLVSYQAQRPNLIRVRNSMFSNVCRLLSDNPEDTESWNEELVREFVGYAPVLEVLADFLYVPNYRKLEQQMAEFPNDLYPKSQHPAWKFLLDVVIRLLDREKDKLVDAFRPSVETEIDGWNAWNTLYGRDEQCERVLCSSFGLDSPTRPQHLPVEIRSAYEDAINIFDHAFVKDEHFFTNVVFRDYLYSWALKHGSTAVTETTKSVLAGNEYRSSPLLAHFYITAETDDDGGFAESEHLGHVYESLLSKELVSRQVRFTLKPVDRDRFLAGFAFGESGVADISFPVVGAGQTLVFRRFLRNADITFRGQVSFGLPDAHFDLGPAVRVKCDVLRTSASEFQVITDRNDGGDVVLESNQYSPEGGVPPDPLVVKGDGTLYVNWPDMAFPWVRYQFVPDPPDIDHSLLTEAFQHFASILAPFRGRGFGALARARPLIDNRPVGSTALGQAIRDHLIDEDILLVRGDLYILNQDRLRELNVTWRDLQLRRMSDELREFLTTFLDQYES